MSVAGAAPARRLYDVIVVGSDLGGMAAAALCARRGLRVLIATLAPVTVSREADGFLLPVAHPVLPPLRQLSAASGPLDELGIAAELQRLGASAAGAFQLLGERLRLSLPADPARRRAELRRELPEAEASETESQLDALERLGRPWDAFLQEVPPYPARGFFERRRLRKLVPAPPELPRGLVGEALAAVAPFAAHTLADTMPEGTAREAAALLRAPVRLWGGAAQLAEVLRKKAQEAGADVNAEPVTALRIERKNVLVTLAGAEVRGSCVVLACDGANVARLCTGGGRAERKVAEESDLTATQKVALAHFVVRPEGLPLALEDAALLLGHAGGALLVSALPARKAKGEASERLLTVAKVVPIADADGAPLLQSVRDALEPVLPFFDRHVVHQSAELASTVPHVLYPEREDGEAIGVRPISDASERVLFASTATYPGFGLEGELLAARACADQALALSGRKSVSAT